MLAVGRALALVRTDVVHPGHPGLPEVPLGALDTDWLPIVGQRGLVVITRDRRLGTKTGELRLLRQHAVRVIALTGKRDLSKWGKLELLVRNWSLLEQRVHQRGPGPWVLAVGQTGGLRELPLR